MWKGFFKSKSKFSLKNFYCIGETVELNFKDEKRSKAEKILLVIASSKLDTNKQINFVFRTQAFCKVSLFFIIQLFRV